MKILFLSEHINIMEYLLEFGDEVTQTTQKLTEDVLANVDFIVSYGYTHIIEASILDRFKDKVINLHISYLPWNRGADPTLWEFLDNTPKGVTIHFMDEKLDTGDIIAQRYLKYDLEDTFRTYYDKKQECIEDLFKKAWPYIRSGRAKRYKQTTCHCLRDKNKYEHLLVNSWDTKVKDLIGKGAK